ncbi:hypothetical protein [Spirosoma flavum]|uniref:Cytochrome C n=1 Tax=Spirosoma flavum TaxID=2048557 RepID=A0ABW6AFQ4_9BACT
MNKRQKSIHYSGLIGSLCIWLLCAWVARQPAPVKKPQPKSVSSQKSRALTPNNPVRQSAGIQAGGEGVQTALSAADSIKPGVVQHDPESGLAIDKNLLLVKGQCTACHSSKLILQSHFDREKWVERIRWMQRTQKLWDLGESEPAILTYLTTYYGPMKIPFDGRRLPLDVPRWYKQAGR